MPKNNNSYFNPFLQTSSGIKNMVKNFNDMNITRIPGGDKYFHCKGNYQAAKQGFFGLATGIALSTLKEMKDIPKWGIKDAIQDFKANYSGWRGAVTGKSLGESCNIYRPAKLPKKY